MRFNFAFSSKLNIVGLLFLFLHLSSVSFAADRTAVNSGNWDQGSTWEGGNAVNENDNITIPSGIMVTCDGAQTFRGNIVVKNGATLNFNVDLYYRANANCKLIVESGAKLNVGNILEIYGPVENSGSIDVNNLFKLFSGTNFHNYASGVINAKNETLMYENATFINDGELNMRGRFTMNNATSVFRGSGTTNMYEIFETVAGSVYDMSTGTTNLIGDAQKYVFDGYQYLSRSKFYSNVLNMKGNALQSFIVDGGGTISAGVFEIDNSSVEGVRLRTEMHVVNKIILTNGVLTLDNVPLFLDGDDNEIVGGGVNSYINSVSGPNWYHRSGDKQGCLFYRKMNNTERWYNFPVGQNGFYCPAQLMPTVSGQVFGVRHYHGGSQADVLSNVAKGKNVTVSSGTGAEFAVDGIADNSRWESEHGKDPQWFIVDLGKVYNNIGKLEIIWETAYAKSFTIDVSSDNANWTNVVSIDNNVLQTPGPIRQVLDIAPVSARYVRFYGTARATQWGYSFHEFRVYTDDVDVIVDSFTIPKDQEKGESAIRDMMLAMQTQEFWKIAAADGTEGGVLVSLEYDDNKDVIAHPRDYVLAYKFINEENGFRLGWELKCAVQYDEANKYIRATKAVVPGAFGCLMSFSPRRNHQWTGFVDDNWFESGNWSNEVPTIDTDVYIEDGASNYPVVKDGELALAKNVFVHGSDAMLTLSPGSSLFCKGNMFVEDQDKSHIIINHSYDKMCNLKVNNLKVGSAANSNNVNEKPDYNKVTVNRSLRANVLYYLGSATKEGTISDGYNYSAGDYMALYNANDESYSDLLGPNPNFGSNFLGHTLGLRQRGESTVSTFTQVGSLQIGEYSFTKENGLLKFTDGAKDPYGWNLVTNPHSYAFPLQRDGGAVPHYGNVANDNPVIWFRRFDPDARKYFWSTFSLATMTGVCATTNTQRLATDDYMIAPHEAFFVKVTNPAINYSWHLITGFVSSSNMVTNSHLKARKIESDVLRLSVVSDANPLMDEMAFVFRDGGSVSHIVGDADKRMDRSLNQVFSIKDGNYLAIPFCPSASEVSDELFPLGVILASGATEGTIMATNIDEFDADEVYLIDFETGESTDLRQISEYSFTANGGSVISERFAINVKKSLVVDQSSAEDDEIATGVSSACSDIMITLNSNDEAVVVVSPDQLDDSSVINVYDVAGRLVEKVSMLQTSTTVHLPSHGIYIVEVLGASQSKRAKLRVK